MKGKGRKKNTSIAKNDRGKEIEDNDNGNLTVSNKSKQRKRRSIVDPKSNSESKKGKKYDKTSTTARFTENEDRVEVEVDGIHTDFQSDVDREDSDQDEVGHDVQRVKTTQRIKDSKKNKRVLKEKEAGEYVSDSEDEVDIRSRNNNATRYDSRD